MHRQKDRQKDRQTDKNYLVNYMTQMQIPAWKLRFHNQIEVRELGHGWKAILTEEILALKPDEFRLAASLRLDIPAPFVNWNSVNVASWQMNIIFLHANMEVGLCGSMMKL